MGNFLYGWALYPQVTVHKFSCMMNSTENLGSLAAQLEAEVASVARILKGV